MSAPLPVLDRSLRVLELATAAPGGLGFEQVREELALPPATASRLLKACVDYGLLVQGDDRRYRVGERLRGLASRIAAPPSLTELVAEPMARLAVACGESAACMVPGDDHVELIAKQALPERFGYAAVGNRNRNHHRHGFALLALAHRPKRSAARLLRDCCDDQAERSVVLDRLPALREAGVVLNRADDQAGIARAAAAVQVGGELRAVVGVTGIAAAWDAARGRELLARVRAAADEIETLLRQREGDTV